jgi:xanthine dehydrogenase accessory factor
MHEERMAFFDRLQELNLSCTPCVMVTLVDVIGGTPQDAGAKMLVTSQGLHAGTVGGGKLETVAIDKAQVMLAEGPDGPRTHFADYHLKKDLGMVCGGTMKLYFEAFHLHPWRIVIFGAGHVAQALIQNLIKLDCQVTCYDTREMWLAKLPDSPKLTRSCLPDLRTAIPGIPDEAFVMLMTMGYVTDIPILIELVKKRSFPYLGVIGSATKAAEMRKAIGDAGLSKDAQSAFICPIGLDIGTNHPQEIAISMIAQLLQERDKKEKA